MVAEIVSATAFREVTRIADVLQEIHADQQRIADHFDPPPADIVGTDYIAKKLNCTRISAARLARDKLPRSCVVPGSGNGGPWKFYRKRVDRWLEEGR
jgi:hypothetical protein